MTNKTLVNDLSEQISLDTKDSNTIFKIVISNEKLMDLTIRSFKNNTIVEELAEILLNLNNKAYIDKHVPKFVRDSIKNNLTVKNIVLNAFQNIVRNIVTEESLKEFLRKGLINVLN